MSEVGWDVDPSLSAWPGRAGLHNTVTADACVIGLGGSGLAACQELADRGLSVVGVDAGRVAAGAAGRNGGFLLGGGAPSFADACRSWGTDLAVRLYRETLAELDRLAAQLGPEVIRRRGSIRLAGLPGTARSDAEAADRAAERDDCAAELRLLRASGIRGEVYDDELGKGIFLPDNAVTNPVARAFGIAAALPSSVRLYEHSPVTSIAPGSVTTANGSVRAGLVVVTVDGRLEVLLPMLAPFVRTARLQMVATAPGTPRRLPCAVYGRWGYDYAQQDDSGRLLVGGGRDRFAAQEWTTDTTPTAGVQAWIDVVAERMAGRPVEVTHRWAASVGFTPDGKALCGWVDDGVVVCGGYSGTGNLVGPVAARAAVALALDGTSVPGYFTSALVR